MSHAFSLYLAVKWLHIVSSVFMVGTGFGSAFYMFFANRSGSVAAQAVVSRLLVRADWWFTTPAILIQPASGLWLAHAAGWPLGAPWIALTLALYALAGACWLPVVWLQLRMARMAQAAHAQGAPLPPLYWRYARRWEALGYPRLRSHGRDLLAHGEQARAVGRLKARPPHQWLQSRCFKTRRIELPARIMNKRSEYRMAFKHIVIRFLTF